MAEIKFFACWEQADGICTVINAFEALRLKRDATIITDCKEKSVLFDIDTGLNVHPVKGRKRFGKPFFSYYPSEESPLKDRSSSFKLSTELIIFLQAFEQIHSFKIQELKNVGDKDQFVAVFVADYFKLHKIEVEEGYVIVKFFFHLKETKPYSYFYKFNGVLALELTVTSSPRPIKSVGLGELGIPLFTAEARIPEWTQYKYGTEFASEEQLKAIVEDIIRTYKKTEYKLFGTFSNEAVTLPEFQEEYKTMSDFERQCNEMRAEIDQLRMECESENTKLKQLKTDVQLQETVITARKEHLNLLEEKIEYYENLEKDNDRLKEEKNQLKEENLRIEGEKGDLEVKSKIDAAEIQRLNAKGESGLLKKLFHKI